MCKIIDTDYLLATILSIKDSVSFEQLWELNTTLNNDLSDVAVDMSIPAIRRAVKLHPAIFVRNGVYIRLNRNYGKKYVTEEFFNYEFPNTVSKELKLKICAIIDNIIP
jgi:hypothetical protein